MPESNISVPEFLRETWDDYNSPTTSTFISKIGICRSAIAQQEENIDSDRSNLNKLKKSLKALYGSGNLHVTNETYLAENLSKLSHGSQKDQEDTVTRAFIKFSVITKELSVLLKHLMQKLNNVLLFPLDNFLKNDLAGVKGDLKKPFDKSWKDYEIKFNKIEKEKKQLAKDAGMIKTEITGPEVAEEMEKERRVFQLQACEYLIKVNEIKTRKGADLLNHLISFYQVQNNYFQDGLKTIEHYKCYIEELSEEMIKLKQKQDQERRELIDLREALKQSVASYNKEQTSTSNSQQSGYRLHQLQGNKIFGCERSGWLLKKSEGKMRKVWQKRKCTVKDGILSISHSDAAKEPVRLNLLTCQVKLIPDDPGKKCFDLISSSENRTYHFQCDDQQELEAWTSVLNNAKNSILMKAFQSEPTSPSNRSSSTTSTNRNSDLYNQRLQELSRAVLEKVKKLKGNDHCCDCGAPNPEWLSVNLGVLICLECCGVHREMGVHISRTQSIVIDDIVTSQLLLARVMTNQGFNEIMEARVEPKNKLQPRSTMEERKHFIRQKYEKRRYAIVTCVEIEDRRHDLKQAIISGDISALLQVYAEGIDFMEPLPDMENEENALHLSIMQEDGYHLYIVDFIIQNTNSRELGRCTSEGNTALHLCALEDKTECMKLMLKANPDLLNQSNNQGMTALHIAIQMNHDLCLELLHQAMSGKSDLFEHVNIDWEFIQDDHGHENDYSDDDLDWQITDSGKSRSRPGSLVLLSEMWMPILSQRSLTTDNLNPLPQPTSRSKNPSAPNGVSSSSGTANFSSSTLIVPSQHESNSQSSGSIPLSNQILKKKAPPPPPPAAKTRGHLRNPSDPGLNQPVSTITRSRLLRDGMPATTTELSLKPVPPAKTQNIPNTGEEKNSNVPPALPPKPSNRMRSQIMDLMMDSSPTSPTFQTQTLTSSSTKKQESLSSSTSSQFSAPIVAKKPESLAKTPSVDTHTRCVALFDCEADNDDELSFKQGEVIKILKVDEEDWWEGEIEGDPSRRGLFPSTFVSQAATPSPDINLDTF